MRSILITAEPRLQIDFRQTRLKPPQVQIKAASVEGRCYKICLLYIEYVHSLATLLGTADYVLSHMAEIKSIWSYMVKTSC